MMRVEVGEFYYNFLYWKEKVNWNPYSETD